MKATIESTPVVTTIDGHDCRVWKGTTEQGVPFVAFINRVAIEEGEDETEFRELASCANPEELHASEVMLAFSLRLL